MPNDLTRRSAPEPDSAREALSPEFADLFDWPDDDDLGPGPAEAIVDLWGSSGVFAQRAGPLHPPETVYGLAAPLAPPTPPTPDDPAQLTLALE